MKGTLHKTQRGWTVKYGSYVNLKSLPLHPDDESAVSQTYINDEYETVYIYVGKEVEFEIVKENVDTGALEAPYIEVEYAKLTPKTEQTNGERFDEFMRTVEYPELEGTVNLCNDIISSREISDEEIEKEAEKITNIGNRREYWKQGIKWYREQLKKK